MEKFCMVLVTAGNADNAKEIAETLVAEKLGACVQMTEINSVYVWNGEVCRDPEILMLIKTRSDLFEAVKNRIAEVHTYEVPEILKFDIADGNKEYLQWVTEQTTK